MTKGINAGTPVEVTVTLPDQVSISGKVRVHCFGHVQRCELIADSKRGLAATFEKFEFLEAR